MIDLLVVGGGPAGLATAIEGALAGLSVTVAEPRRTPIDKACGEGLMPGAVARLRRLGVELDGHPFHGIRYIDPTHCAEARFGSVQGIGVRRTTLHAALWKRALGLGIPVLPTRVDRLDQRDRYVEAAGIRARYVAAADGLHSPVRRMLGLALPSSGGARYGLRRHFRLAPWSAFVEVHWSGRSEAYVTPVSSDLVGVAILTGDRAAFDVQVRSFPTLLDRLCGAPAATTVRGAGPLRQRVRSRVAGRVLLVGDAAGYIDALTGEGISVALAAAEALVACVRADRPQDYEQAWRRVSRRYRLLTHGLLWARRRRLLAERIVPLSAALPTVFSGVVRWLA